MGLDRNVELVRIEAGASLEEVIDVLTTYEAMADEMEVECRLYNDLNLILMVEDIIPYE